MTLNDMVKAGNVIDVNDNYLTDDGIVIIRCNGRGTSTYWVRNDDIFTAYTSVVDAYREFGGRDIRTRMRRSTALAILSSVKYFVRNGGEIIENN